VPHSAGRLGVDQQNGPLAPLALVEKNFVAIDDIAPSTFSTEVPKAHLLARFCVLAARRSTQPTVARSTTPSTSAFFCSPLTHARRQDIQVPVTFQQRMRDRLSRISLVIIHKVKNVAAIWPQTRPPCSLGIAAAFRPALKDRQILRRESGVRSVFRGRTANFSPPSTPDAIDQRQLLVPELKVLVGAVINHHRSRRKTSRV